MSDSIPSLARARAHAAAVLEHLSGDDLSEDNEERKAQIEAERVAHAAYVKAEQAYARAVSTMSAKELAELEGSRPHARAAQ